MLARSYDDLQKMVKMHGGVLNVSMGELRDINGSDRLGPNIINTIKDKLSEKGLGYFPEEMEAVQWKRVRLYAKGTAIEKLINAVLDISNEGDEGIRQFANDDLAKALRAVKDAVCDLKI